MYELLYDQVVAVGEFQAVVYVNRGCNVSGGEVSD